jgi:hypothetical protein
MHSVLSRLLKWRDNVLSLVVFIPNLTPFRELFSSEIFPWAFFYSLRRNLKFNALFIIFLAYMFVSLIAFQGLANNFMSSLRSVMALLNASLIFIAIQNVDSRRFEMINRGFIVVAVFNFILIALQSLEAIPKFIEPAIQNFIPRFNVGSWGSGRGVSGLFSEPSYLSISFQYFVIYLLYIYQVSFSKLLGIGILFLLVFTNLFVIKSVTGTIMSLVIILGLMKRKYLLLFSALVVIFSVGLYLLLRNSENLPRSLEVVFSFMDNRDYQDPLPVLLEQSGFRLVSIWSSYSFGVQNLLGSGIGNWPAASVSAMESIGVPAESISFFASITGNDYFGVRPTSFAAGLMLELGLVGLIIYTASFVIYFENISFSDNVHFRLILLIFIFNFFVLGTIGDPLPFAVLSMSLRRYYLLKDAVG